MWVAEGQASKGAEMTGDLLPNLVSPSLVHILTEGYCMSALYAILSSVDTELQIVCCTSSENCV